MGIIGILFFLPFLINLDMHLCITKKHWNFPTSGKERWPQSLKTWKLWILSLQLRNTPVAGLCPLPGDKIILNSSSCPLRCRVLPGHLPSKEDRFWATGSPTHTVRHQKPFLPELPPAACLFGRPWVVLDSCQHFHSISEPFQTALCLHTHIKSKLRNSFRQNFFRVKAKIKVNELQQRQRLLDRYFAHFIYWAHAVFIFSIFSL